MDARTFKKLMGTTRLRDYNDGSQLCNQGNKMHAVYFVALVNPNYRIALRKDGFNFFHLEEGSWIGAIEAVTFINQLKEHRKHVDNDPRTFRHNIKWGISANLIKRQSLDEEDDIENIFLSYREACYLIEFDLDDLKFLFTNEFTGSFMLNSFSSIWLKYTSKTIIGIDKNLLNYRKKKVELDNASKLEEKPINESNRGEVEDEKHLETEKKRMIEDE